MYVACEVQILTRLTYSHEEEEKNDGLTGMTSGLNSGLSQFNRTCRIIKN